MAGYPNKNGLSICLTESAVFLRNDSPSSHPHRNAEIRSSLVRGLLVLELAKTTRIMSIELELVATSSTTGPEGVGARRVEVSEQHQVYHASTIYFKANGSLPTARRAASIGPGTLPNSEDPTLDWDEDEISVPLQQPTARTTFAHNVIPHHSHTVTTGTSEPGHPPLPPPNNGLSRTGRRMSVDSSNQVSPISYRENANTSIPPYSPVDPNSPVSIGYPLSPRRSLACLASEYISPPAQQHREESRADLHSSLRNKSPSQISLQYAESDDGHSQTLPSDISPNPQPPQPLHTSTPISTLASGHDSRPYFLNTSRASSILNRNNESALSISQASPTAPALQTHPSSPLLQSTANRGPNSSASRERHGRNQSRFSLTAVADVFREAVRSTPPMANKISRVSNEGEENHHGSTAGPRSRERTVDDYGWMGSRGRTIERSVEGDNHPSTIPRASEILPLQNVFESTNVNHRKASSHPREPVADIFAHVFDDAKEKKTTGNGWKEFKRGTYTYPVSFSIPSTAPPTLQCNYGAVVWKLNAHVHRPGTFTPKYTATREVQVIACPTEEDTEDTENIIIERHWDQQLQYLVSISGRSFYIGGTMPVTFVFMPLAKIKIYRLSMVIEERVDYYDNMRRVARSDPITRFHLLSVKHDGKYPSHILPLDSDETNALKNSPVSRIVNPEDDPSEVASALMGPGPWSFHQELKLPTSCDSMRFTNKNRRANITISHHLKVIIRLERGDDLYVDKAGKRKMFDIVIQTPVHILSCRCNPEWISLPRYEEAFTGSNYVIPNCPCQVRKLVSQQSPSPISPEFHVGPFHAHIPSALERMRHHSSLSSLDQGSKETESHPGSSSHAAEPTVQAIHIHASETSPIDPAVMTSLKQISELDPRNAQMLLSSARFERLMAGFESEFGEAPPAYNLVTSNGSSVPSSSSVAVR